MIRYWLAVTLSLLAILHASETGAAEEKPPVRAARVLVLSTMLADDGIGEWGFSALVEVDGHQILFDTGTHPDTVLRNAAELGVDLAKVTDVVLSHNHDDHTGGLVHLRQELMRRNPAALSRAHVAPGIFESRLSQGKEDNPMLQTRPQYLATGGKFIEHAQLDELWPGVWLTGPVPRRYPERNWSGHRELRTAAGLVEDTLPEDQALILDTPAGLVVVTGCGHAGIVNTVAYGQKGVRAAPLHAVIGGLHLFAADDQQLDFTARELRQRGLSYLLGAHCTGIEALYHLRQGMQLPRKAAVVGAVGSSFTLGSGIDPRRLAR